MNSKTRTPSSSRKVEANLVIGIKLNLYRHNCNGDRDRDNMGPYNFLRRLGTSFHNHSRIFYTTSCRDGQHYTSRQTRHRPKNYVSYYTFICFRMLFFDGLCFSLLLHRSERHSVSSDLCLHYHRNENNPNIHYDLHCNLYT